MLDLDHVLLESVKTGEETLLTNERITEFGNGVKVIDA